MDFVIDRSKWRCGGDGPNRRGSETTQLLNAAGFMCCLGQVCEQAGVPKSELHGIGEPIDIDIDAKSAVYELLIAETGRDLTCNAITTNDNPAYMDFEREQKLTELFAKYGHNITFVGDYWVPATT